MAWIILVLSGMLEAVWAAALGASHGFKRKIPTLIFAVSMALSMALSMAGLAWAMTSLPTGTAYAVWVGIGATLTVIWGFVKGYESPTTARVLPLVLLVSSVIGLKVVS